MRGAVFVIAVCAAAFFTVASSSFACSSWGEESPDAGPDAPEGGPPLDGSKGASDSARPKDHGRPFLTELTVSGAPGSDGSARVGLVPTFSPDVQDYYVRCAAGINVLRVSMKASSGAMSSLIRPTASGYAQRQTLTVRVQEDQAIVAAAVNDHATMEYWVRCLPPEFPQLRMTSYGEGGAPPGYYLVGKFLPLDHHPFAIVLDERGVPVWYHRGSAINDVDEVVPGSVSFYSQQAPSYSYLFETDRLSLLGTSKVLVGLGGLGRDTPSATTFDGHELRVLPNGDYMILSNPSRSGVDLSSVEVFLPDGGHDSFGPSSTIQDCDVVEFDPRTGIVVWRWSAFDHLDPLEDTRVWELAAVGTGTDGGTVTETGPDGGPVVDPFHCNSIDVDPANGNLLVSARELDSIFYIDKLTGAILWKMGGSAFTKDSATYVAVADTFQRQHDARFQPGWSADCNGGTGRISMFDDESYTRAAARGVVYDVVVGPGDGGPLGCDGGTIDAGVGGQAALAWQYSGTMSSRGLGSFRISADGSRVIGWGYGAPNLVFTEVDVDGNKLLDFEFTDGNSSYRAIKVPPSALDLNAMRNTAGLP
jgi:hypothetical protein